MSVERYNAITSHWADDSKCRSNRERVLFHYFNPNGLYKQHRSMCDTISQYVDDGIVTTGWLLAYGSLNSFSTNELVKLFDHKKVNGISLAVCLEMIQDDINRGYERLGEFILSDELTAAQMRSQQGFCPNCGGSGDARCYC